jgi:hypothetical protein
LQTIRRCHAIATIGTVDKIGCFGLSDDLDSGCSDCSDFSANALRFGIAQNRESDDFAD